MTSSRDAASPAHAAPVAPAWFERRRAQVDAALAADLKIRESGTTSHSRLLEAVEYSVSSGGKRLRPVLVLECCVAAGGDDAAGLPAALAIEYVHTFSLIHDDLPAMDDDDLRRGRPTNHKVYGEAVAILAGDWLLARAFERLGDAPPRCAAVLSECLANDTLAMIEGQAADIAGESTPPNAELVRFVHEHKTARLIRAACRMGAIAAGASPLIEAALSEYGLSLGRAFQIADDLLDVLGSAAATGKSVGKDAARNKQTYPAVFGIDASRAQLMHCIDAAKQALGPLGPLGGRSANLSELAGLMAFRDR
ncbi:MAG: polyprenyl synthetase family protein [Phycisphaerales bacterium]|nr:polyprenyl synthetase family protein [Phycisphaerales bacterium]